MNSSNNVFIPIQLSDEQIQAVEFANSGTKGKWDQNRAIEAMAFEVQKFLDDCMNFMQREEK